jgi:hypothetical protein
MKNPMNAAAYPNQMRKYAFSLILDSGTAKPSVGACGQLAALLKLGAEGCLGKLGVLGSQPLIRFCKLFLTFMFSLSFENLRDHFL